MRVKRVRANVFEWQCDHCHKRIRTLNERQLSVLAAQHLIACPALQG